MVNSKNDKKPNKSLFAGFNNSTANHGTIQMVVPVEELNKPEQSGVMQEEMKISAPKKIVAIEAKIEAEEEVKVNFTMPKSLKREIDIFNIYQDTFMRDFFIAAAKQYIDTNKGTADH